MIEIDIISDVVCPWCFIGKRRLEKALALVRQEEPEFSACIRWQPFFLNPDTPPEGEPYFPFLERKFGGRAEVETIFDRVRAAGAPYGVTFAFEKIALRANTLMAHRLIHWGQRQGDASALVERLFVAQFQRGEHVGDLPTLVRIAVECGYNGVEAEAYLASGLNEDAVRVLERQARERGIAMVPTFVIGGSEIIVGAEDPAILAEGLRRVLASR
ncbi:MAG: DsbA family oxidoreductase [Rhodocyclaceae bacterium]|nr:DsbA family oxidoreductase [Rhodocyclaceae bacterium]